MKKFLKDHKEDVAEISLILLVWWAGYFNGVKMERRYWTKILTK